MSAPGVLFPEAEMPLGPPIRVGMGRMLAGSNAKPRQGNDYYPTPPSVTAALLTREGQCIKQALGDTAAPVWEPCAHGGAILRVLQQAGFATIGTDIIVDAEHDVAYADLLSVRRAPGRVVVTNFPFALAAAMIRHVWCDLQVNYLAGVFKSSFWHAAARTGLFRIARIYALNWRPDFLGGGAPTMDVIWCVWQRGWALGTQYDVLTPTQAGGFDFEGEGE